MHNKPMRNMAAAILTTMLSGLSLTIYNIFTDVIPNLEADIKVLKTKDEGHDEIHGLIQGDLGELKKGQERIMEHLLRQRE